FLRGFLRYSHLEDMDGAASDFGHAARLDSEGPLNYYYRGRVLNDSKDYDSALSDFNRAIMLGPQFAEAYYYRGLVRKAKGDLKGALADLDQGQRLNPSDSMYATQIDAIRRAGK
ncbi:MAG: tetratricopeptide repeat protein, partial [Singulisphaera sp.]